MGYCLPHRHIVTILGCVWSVLALSGPGAIAQEASSPTAAHSDDEVSAPQSSQMPSLIQELPDYSGDLGNRMFLTGDWGGARTKLANQGILFELDATQILQGNAHGGKDTNNAFRYSGSVDYTIKLDTARMKLWPGGLFTFHGETQFGQGIQGKVGSILPANFDAILPTPDRQDGLTTLSEFYYTQALSEKLVILLGKVDVLGLADKTEFASSEKTQFMNFGFRVNPMLAMYAPYTPMTAAVVAMPTDWLTLTTMAIDTNGTATRTGFDTAFHSPEGMSLAQEWVFKIKPFNLPGSQTFGYGWSSKDFRLLDQDRRLVLPRTPGSGLLGLPMRLARAARRARGLGDPDKRPDDWLIYYNFSQYLYTEAEDPTQGFGLFGRFGWSTGKANPIEQFYSIGVGGKGVVPDRNNDTFGVGYYHANFSDDLPSILNVNSEQGVELFYNIEITPWLHITPDLQIIMNPGGGFQDRDVALVYGLRAQMSF